VTQLETLAPPAARNPYKIRTAAVLGAGTMGAGIAAHLANAGIPTLLLDLPGEGPDRNALARKGLERALGARPPAFMLAEQARLIELGNIQDDLARAARTDWVVEAAFENLEVKRDLLGRLEPLLGETTLVTSNSSGIPMRLMAQGRSESFRRRFFGTHFFNPPRYLHLLEIIPGPDTDPLALEAMARFADRRLGKGVVFARDVPGFAANRVGAYGWLVAIKAAIDMGLSPDVVDFLTGPLIGRPKSATFRTADLAGLDILYTVARDLARATGEDFSVPPLLETLVQEKKWLGDKSGQGFFKKVKNPDGSSTILTLNFQTLEYEDRGKVRLEEVEAIRKLPTAEARLAALLDLPGPVGDFLRRVIFRSIHYAATKIGEVAATAQDLDNAVRWGFNYEMGPIETARSLGRERVLRGLADEGLDMPPALEAEMAAPPPASYRVDGGPILLRRMRDRVVLSNSDASLLDLGEGVACLEFHSKANSIGEKVLEMTSQALERVERDFVGLVIGNQGENFSAGANLALLLELASSGDYARIDQAVRLFQGITSRLRYCPFPVVAAPFKLNLGGGCEFALWSDAQCADAELYTGLVEVGVGIIPAGGGTTEVLLRMNERLLPGADPFAAVRAAFELIATARVSTSALEARQMGLLRPSDEILMNSERPIAAARRRVLYMAPDYVPPARRQVTLLGESAYANLCAAALAMHSAGQITEYEVHLARTLAGVLTGGPTNRPATVDEQVVLDLEREAFLSLCGQEKTRERLAHTLKTGKTLRN
jgi:3-hydroxyacyl-CoA dehydrogenase